METKPQPQKINLAVRLTYFTIILSVLKATWTEASMIGTQLTGSYLAKGIPSLIIIGFLAWSISKGKNWARIALLVLWIVSLIPLAFTIPYEFRASSIIGLSAIALAGLRIYVLFILFSKESNPYFKTK